MNIQGVDIIPLIGWAINWYKRKTNEPIPIGRIVRDIEHRYKLNLSNETKNELLEGFRNRDDATVIKNTNGKIYVIFGELDIL